MTSRFRFVYFTIIFTIFSEPFIFFNGSPFLARYGAFMINIMKSSLPGVSLGLSTWVFRPKVYLGEWPRITVADLSNL